MKLKVAALLACLCASSFVVAQNIVPIQQLQVAPRPAASIAQIDQEAVERTRLERENAKLKEENAALKQRIEALTTLGGSEVRAYCAAPNVSKNTAGAENNCADAGYSCDDVSGLCNTRCNTSDECSGGEFRCDTEHHVCIKPPPPSDD
jgi:FtsZ-binding cell division protein ZapB